jgi:hypothetical protein
MIMRHVPNSTPGSHSCGAALRNRIDHYPFLSDPSHVSTTLGCNIVRFNYAISGPFDFVMMLVGKGPYPICRGLGFLDTAPL